jgi:hypothetical protein
MTELPERCFRNAVEFTESISRAISLLEKGAKNLKDQSAAALAIDDAAQWLKLSNGCLDSAIYDSINKELSSDFVGPDQMSIPSMRQRILDSLYNVRRETRTPFGMWKVNESNGQTVSRDPYSGEEIKE